MRQYCQGVLYYSKTTFLSEVKANGGNAGKTTIAIRTTTHNKSFVQQQAVLKKKTVTYETLGVRAVYFVYTVQKPIKQLVEQQSIELMLVQQTQQLQHSVQVRIVRKLRRHETSAETPHKCQLRDGTRTASEADGSVF